MGREKPTTIRLILLFLGASLGAAVLMATVLGVLGLLFGMAINPGAVGWLAMVYGAARAGQGYGRGTGVKPANGYAWRVTFGFVVLAIVLLVFIGFAALAIVTPHLFATLDHIVTDVAKRPLMVRAALATGYMLALWALLRLAFGVGAGRAVRMQTRPDAPRAP